MENTEEKPLVDKKYLLEKIQGKGGWTYAEIPEILPDKHTYFNWVRVRGFIDNYEIKAYHLMPMGNGKMFLPVKTAIRKKIGKKEGDWVHVILYRDSAPFETPEEFLQCLTFEPEALEKFNKLTDSRKKEICEWIYEAKKEETRANRIVKVIKMILLGEKRIAKE